MRRSLATVVATMVATIVGLAAPSCGSRRAAPTRYEIPQGFTGWVTVVFAVPGAPALPEDHGARLVRVPAGGTVRTSSPQEVGIVDNHFYFVDAAGVRTPIDDPQSRPGAAPDEAARHHDHPVVLGFETGDAGSAAARRVFERFYVGPGPAGQPPRLP